ncbi:MAG: hypothetical protein JRH20_31615, partial [Deltaproteobacteria bacterium]|nr:hypothetical protein [Deltaproteobacteria bacterium]
MAPLTMPERFVMGRSRIEPKVVLIGSAAQELPGLAKRLRAELGALGLEVVPVEAKAHSLHGRLAELGAQAVTHRAVAAVRVERQAKEQRVTLWLYDAVTGKMLFRQALLKKGAAATPAANVSLQVVELIHASLLELNLPMQR